MEYVAQFLVTFGLGWAVAFSLKKWAFVIFAVTGVLALPVLLIILVLGEGSFWEYLGALISHIAIWFFETVGDLFKSAAVLTVGCFLGVMKGLGWRW